MGYVYLASPYTAGGASSFLRELRYLQAMEHMAWMLRRGVHVYSPIVHCHELAKVADLPKDSSFWEEYNFTMLDGAESLHILMLRGWECSAGIDGEECQAVNKGIPVFYVELCKE